MHSLHTSQQERDQTCTVESILQGTLRSVPLSALLKASQESDFFGDFLYRKIPRIRLSARLEASEESDTYRGKHL